MRIVLLHSDTLHRRSLFDCWRLFSSVDVSFQVLTSLFEHIHLYNKLLLTLLFEFWCAFCCSTRTCFMTCLFPSICVSFREFTSLLQVFFDVSFLALMRSDKCAFYCSTQMCFTASMLQHMLQHSAHCNTYCNTHCNTHFNNTATASAMCWSTVSWQHTATHSSTQQHTATCPELESES